MVDLTMQSVPISRDHAPEREQLPITPESDLRGVAAEVEERKRKKGKRSDHNKSSSHEDFCPAGEPSAWSTILQAILVTILGFMPWFLVWMSYDYSEYDLSRVKGSIGLNSFQEFYRWTVFIIVSYDLLLLAELPLRLLPRFFLFVARSMDPDLSRNKVIALACLRNCARYCGYALAFLIISWLADTILYVPARNLASDQILALLNPKEKLEAQQLLAGERIESALAAFLLLSLFMAAEKYCVAAIRSSFHRLAIGPRVMQCNRKLQVLGALHRSRQSASTISTTSLGHTLEERDEYLAPIDKDLDFETSEKSKRLANSIFKSLTPANRDVIVASDLRAYFSGAECEMAFRIFDTNRSGELGRSEFRAAVMGIYEERNRLAAAIVANDSIVEKLDWTLCFIFGLLGLLFAMVVWNHKGYGWVTSLGTFILGFSFLFRPTLEKVFNTFLFVFVEHAYDVSDRVIIGDESLLVNEVEIFTTVFIREDGTIVYAPNSSLRGKTIYNRQRTASEKDEIVIRVPATTDIKKLADIRGRLTDYLSENVNEFTGSVTVTINKFEGEGSARTAKVSIESKFRPMSDGLKSDAALQARRQESYNRFQAICSEIGLEYMLNE